MARKDGTVRMRTTAVVCVVGICHVVPVKGQHIPINQSTTAPPQARFEILQTEPTVGSTFRLDRWTGRVDELVATKAREPVWQEMDVPGRPEVLVPGSPRFRLFTSDSEWTAPLTFLLDTETGQTWQLVWAKPNPFGVGQGRIWSPLR